ncbi:hypothetical protein [Helicobacter apodemus]|uniref:Integrase catalytic domain-containing protein n=1 Tax=Helicobacter apodemus TaxID=135569 RepID=A0A2U8FC29_9HELI|nr:hypothetical protein [Helicobacter apodemus]AWI33558.1 hypothetical protein CDV25_01375 [Helicobacter apodemus]
MGQWISSGEFAEKYGINVFTIYKSAKRANQKGKKICKFIGKIFPISYKNNLRGGNAGKVLQIWNTPLTSAQVEALEKGYPIKYVLEEMGEVVETARVNESMKSFKQSPSNEEVVESNNDEVAQSNVMESKDSITLDCKGDKDETYKTLKQDEAEIKQNKTEILHHRRTNHISKCDCNTTRSSDSTSCRNDCFGGGVGEAPVCESMDLRSDEICYAKIKSIHNDAVETTNAKSLKENCTTWHNLTPNQKAQAKHREKILIDYESAKASGIRVADFLVLKNKEDSTLKLTQGKLFDWARKYKTQGLSGLSDKRGVAKTGTTSLPAWAQVEAVKMWRVMGSGYLNKMQLWRELHIIAHLYVEGYSYEKFLKCEIPPLFSLNTLNRFLDSYLKANSLEYTLITYGTDKTDSYKEPAYGMQRDLYTLPNQLWQIDSSPLDAIVLDNDGKQIRPSILSIIDVYSGRNVAYLSERSDSNAV